MFFKKGRCEMEALKNSSFEIDEFIGNRSQFFDSVWVQTCRAYMNEEEDLWFKNAVRDRINDSKGIVCAYVDGVMAGYVGYDVYWIRDEGKILYIDIATCFTDFSGRGIIRQILGSFRGFDAIMLRTQNPNMADSLYQVVGNCEPLTHLSESGKRVAEIIGRSWENYNRETLICKGIYNGKCLTGQEIHGRSWFDNEIYSRIKPSEGDAVILVAFTQERPVLRGGF